MSIDELQTGNAPAGSGEGETPGRRETDAGISLTELFEREGESQPVTGQRPLLLEDTDLVWLVTGAPVHLFVVPLDGGEDEGGRRPFASVDTGQLLFAPNPVEVEGVRYGILASGLPDTRLVSLPLEDLEAQLQDDHARRAFRARLRRWMVSLQHHVRPPYAPQHAGSPAADGAAVVNPGDSLMALNSPAWVRVEEGVVELFGLSGLDITVADGPVLLADGSWVTATQPTGISTVEDVSRAEILPATRRMTRLAIAAAVLRELEAHTRERQRLAQAAATDRVMTDRALRGILHVFEDDHAIALPDITTVQDRLLAACMLVGAVRGIDVVAPPVMKEASADPLRSIARASRFRTRQVMLDGTWWEDDSGPLLGYLAAGDDAVALIPRQGKGYVLIDPITSEETEVDKDVAARLSPWAQMFYRPFPQRIVFGKDLLSLAFRDAKRDILAIVLLGIFGGVLGIATPLATGRLVNNVIPESDRAQLLELSLALLASAFAVAAFTITRNVALLRVEGRADGAAQAAVWDRLLSLPVPFFKDYTAGELGARAMGIDRIRQSLSDSTTTAILAFVFTVPSFVLQLVIDARLAMVSLGLLVALLLLTLLATRRQLRLNRRMQEVGGYLSGLVLQLLNGIPKLRVAGAEQRAFSVWAASYREQSTLVRNNQVTQLQLTVLYATFPVLATFALFGVYATQEWFSIGLGEFLSFNAAFTQVIGATIAMSTAIGSLIMVVPIYERLRPILDALPESDDGKADPGVLRGDIEVSRVRFAYNEGDPPVLDDVSFHARPGEFIAFVGPSGAGKSTLFRLLMGFESPTSGSVLYDGKNVENVDLQSLRRQMGVVLQNGTLMPGELGQNIIGATQMSLDDAWEAARMAGLAEDIEAMPMGMHTYIMEGGTTLSGGQRQRLMIARAIVNRPRILLFDEATSALDNRTQEIVSRSLQGLNSTRIVIAHRLSTIAKADVIHVMERGRIVQSGTYEELMEQDGPFRELARRQIA